MNVAAPDRADDNRTNARTLELGAEAGQLRDLGVARSIGGENRKHIRRFASRGHFASWNGTAPLDASSADQQHHRLSRAGNRRINRVLHIMAIVQLRHDTAGRAYYRRHHRHRDESGRTSGGDSAIQRG